MPLDQADLDKIAALIKASQTPEVLGPVIGGVLKPTLDELKTANVSLKTELDQMKAKVDKPAEKPADKAADKPADKPGEKGGDSSEVAALRARLDAAEKAREEEVNARKVDAFHATVRDALGKAGISADRVPMALSWLKDQGVLDPEKQGWRGKDRLGMDAVLGVEEGAAAWLKSDTGKFFLPPTQATSPTPPGGGPPLGNNGVVKLSDLRGSGVLGSALAQIGNS